MVKELKEGQKAPQFVLKDHHRSEVTLEDLKGKWVVLYFYPKDNTPGCTVEAVEFTSHLSDFKEHNALVLGVSPDSCESHIKFIADHSLRVWLLSDPEKKAAEQYNVWKEKKMFGKTYLGIIRSTFLIDPEGIIQKVWYNVKVTNHIKEVLKTLKELT